MSDKNEQQLQENGSNVESGQQSVKDETQDDASADEDELQFKEDVLLEEMLDKLSVPDEVKALFMAYTRGVQPAARGPNVMQQNGFLCRSLVLDSLCETKAWPAV